MLAGPGQAVGLHDADHVARRRSARCAAASRAGRCRCCPGRRWPRSRCSNSVLGMRWTVARSAGATMNSCVPLSETTAPNSVLGRAFTLLTAFRPGDGAVSIGEMCRRTGVAKPTAHRLLHQLAEWDAVERTADGVRLGMRPVRARPARAAAARPARGRHAVPVRPVRGHRRDRAPRRRRRHRGRLRARSSTAGAGPPSPPASGAGCRRTAPGWARRCSRSRRPDRLAAVLAAGLRPAHAAHGHRPRPAHEGAGTRSASTGCAEEHEESTVGIACVAAPVLDADGRAVAAVSITGLGQPARHRPSRPGRAHRRTRPVPHAARRRWGAAALTRRSGRNCDTVGIWMLTEPENGRSAAWPG